MGMGKYALEMRMSTRDGANEKSKDCVSSSDSSNQSIHKMRSNGTRPGMAARMGEMAEVK
ncbi:hypothetical protein B0H12DRAFT_1135962 [Mycena haematopus]|nr:hypothetical protein B0H12DRAFT_1135962 [Mycena haematopus]